MEGGLFSILYGIPVLGDALELIGKGAWWCVSQPADSVVNGAQAVVKFFFGGQG